MKNKAPISATARPVARKLRFRRYRHVGLSRRVWQQRAIFFIGAVLIGLIAVAFAGLADQSQASYAYLLRTRSWLPLMLTPLGFASLAYVTRRWFPAAAGSGIPQVIAARSNLLTDRRQALLGWQTTLAKIVMTSLAPLVGASVGREGPTVQVGASVMFIVATVFGHGRRNGLVLAGSAAGVAAAFNAPLAGILFAIEEIAKTFSGRINDIVVGSVVIAGGISSLLIGNHAYFGMMPASLDQAKDWLAVPMCACLGGVFGGLFSATLIRLTEAPPRLIATLKGHPVAFAALCGFAVSILSIATSGFASGNGYAETRAGLIEGVEVPWWFGVSKLVATLLSSLSGIPGGLFSPSLAVGAGLGAMMTSAAPFIDPRALVLFMTAGYFAAVVQSPLTAVVIVMEMTGNHQFAIPMMATALFAAGISRMINRKPLYHALARSYLAEPLPVKSS